MAKTLHIRIGPRDIDLLQNIDRCPMTTEQLFQLSVASGRPFRSLPDLRRRLRQLKVAKMLNCWPYAIATTGRSPLYFKLTREGFRFLYGEDYPLPRRRHFESISPGHHHHTLSLSSLLVHLVTHAAKHGHTIENYARENSVKLTAAPFVIYPDGAFVLRRNDGKAFPFCIELDNGTERVRSKQDVECIERKLRGYDAHQSQFATFDADRYVVLLVTTRSKQRLDNMLSLASGIMSQPQRTVFIGASLDALLKVDPFETAVFEDHRSLKRMLIPMTTNRKKRQSIQHEAIPTV